MLKSVRIDNFRGFDAPVEFNFTASSYGFNEAVVCGGLVKNAIVYGRNGVGKSALGIGIFDIVSHLTDKERISEKYIVPYCNMNTGRKIAEFRFVFDFDGEEVAYEYEKSAAVSLVRERLFSRGELLIDYEYGADGKSYVKPGLVGGLNLALPDNRLSIIKYIYRNTPTNTVPQITRLMDFVERMLWYRSLSDGNDYAGFMNGTGEIDESIYRSGRLPEFIDFLSKNGVDYDLSFVEREGRHYLVVRFANGEQVSFDKVASTGTKALRLFFHWSATAFAKASFVFIDEFDAFLHYESAANIVQVLNSLKGVQSVLTSHNTYLMRNDLTRPDCCFIMTKNKVTPLSKATDKVLREGHNLEKMYVNGAFTEP